MKRIGCGSRRDEGVVTEGIEEGSGAEDENVMEAVEESARGILRGRVGEGVDI